MTSNKRIDFRLYLITDRKLITHHSSLITAVEEALKAGVRAVQLREKDLPTRPQLDMAYRMRELTTKYNAMLLINDRVDIAMCARADGVHLGQAGMPVNAVRKVVGDKLFIGASTHSLKEALSAEEEGADFITFGPVYRTASKLRYGEPLGIEAIRNLPALSVPVIGIGGIGPDNVKEVLSAGASGVAVISGILGQSDVRGAAARYIREVNQ